MLALNQKKNGGGVKFDILQRHLLAQHIFFLLTLAIPLSSTFCAISRPTLGKFLTAFLYGQTIFGLENRLQRMRQNAGLEVCFQRISKRSP